MIGHGIFDPAGPGYRDRAQVRATAQAELAHFEAHRAVVADAESFAAGTVDRYVWDAAASAPGMRLVGGRCETCGSDLGIQVADDHALVAELERGAA